MTIYTIFVASLIGLYIGATRQIVFKYIDDIYQCMPVLNRYMQRNEVFNKHLLFAYNIGLFLGCITVKIMASMTNFGKALTVIIKKND